MKLPRDIDGVVLVRLLTKYGYCVTRQSGSHIRITTDRNGKHNITIPAHKPLKIGTLSEILKEISKHLEISKDELLQELFHN